MDKSIYIYIKISTAKLTSTWQTYANLSYDSHMIHETMWIYYDLPRGNDPICAILRTIQSLEGLRFVPDLGGCTDDMIISLPFFLLW